MKGMVSSHLLRWKIKIANDERMEGRMKITSDEMIEEKSLKERRKNLLIDLIHSSLKNSGLYTVLTYLIFGLNITSFRSKC